MIPIQHTEFPLIWGELNKLLANAPVVDVGEWQAIQGAPQAKTIEVEDVSFSMPVPGTAWLLQQVVEPSLPWAEEHFLERISGEPWNPPPSHERWPYRQEDNKEHLNNEKFSHTYPERFWPRFANVGGKTVEGRQVTVPHTGIRFEYGDLASLIELLSMRPHTRQAYLPVWFPEDLRASWSGERVPCTLGYHFMARQGFLKCVYYIRSCDLYRHFRDDVYMAARLLQYLVGEVNRENEEYEDDAWQPLKVGKLVMHISSLHIFEPERTKAERQSYDPLTETMWW